MNSSHRGVDQETVFEEISLNLGDAANSWDLLSSHVEAFLQCWETASEPPKLGDHLPSGAGALRRIVLAELVKIDLEYRHQQHEPRRLEDYLAEYPELGEAHGPPTDLIYEEYHLRKSSGEAVEASEYFARFPQHTDALRRLFQLDGPTVSASLASSRLHISLQPGDQIDDFQLVSELGKGAFGSVFLARQESIQRLVALKVTRDQGSEAKNLAQLDNPHIVRVYDQRRLVAENLRLLYMQFVPGGTLQSVVTRARRVEQSQRSGRLLAESIASELDRTGVVSGDAVPKTLVDRPWAEVVCQLGVELGSALQHAHSQGMLHRDVKPANVLLGADGSAHLADFNISFSSQLGGASPAAYFGGSLAYMSPEQLDACNPNHERSPEELAGTSDIYSLGVVLWELFYGDRPFGDEQVESDWCQTLATMSERRRNDLGETGETTDDDVGDQLTTILRRCLSPDPGHRYPDAGALRRELSWCLNPRLARLLRSTRRGWPRMVLCWPTVAIVFAAILPNMLAGVFNYVYNERAIVQQLEGSQATFWGIQLVINSLAFPLGLVVGLLYSWPVIRAVRNIDRRPEPPDVMVLARSLSSGRFIAVLGIIEWLVAGLAYPVSLHVLVGGMDVGQYAHFFVSLLICGMIAAAYPFFLVSMIAIRVFLPALLQDMSLSDAARVELQRLSRQMSWFLYLAGGVPAAGVMFLVIAELWMQQQQSFALFVLSATGAVGFALALGLFRVLQTDVAALLQYGD